MIQMFLEKKLLEMAKSFSAISVTRPRQSGKTTLVKKAFPQHAYVNLENLDGRSCAEEFLKQQVQKVSVLFNYLQEDTECMQSIRAVHSDRITKPFVDGENNSAWALWECCPVFIKCKSKP